jgi:hypothetical protein
MTCAPHIHADAGSIPPDRPLEPLLYRRAHRRHSHPRGRLGHLVDEYVHWLQPNLHTETHFKCQFAGLESTP